MIWFLLFNSFVYYICSIVCCYSVLVNLEKYFIYYFPIWLYLLLGSLAIPKSHTNYVNVLEDVGRATEYSFICTQYDVHFEEWRRYRITRNLWKKFVSPFLFLCHSITVSNAFRVIFKNCSSPYSLFTYMHTRSTAVILDILAVWMFNVWARLFSYMIIDFIYLYMYWLPFSLCSPEFILFSLYSHTHRCSDIFVLYLTVTYSAICRVVSLIFPTEYSFFPLTLSI